MSVTPASTRCAIYLRQSLDLTREGLAIDRQRDDCRRIAAERGWIVVAEFVDNSVSASGHKRRPGYDQLVAAYAEGAYDALVCWDLDRLTRQPRQLEDWIEAASARGLRLVTANGEADLTTDAGQLFARIKAAVARSEVDRKAARQRAAAFQRAEHGKPPLGVRLTGYTVKGQVVEREATLVRELFARFAAGDSLRSLAAWLTQSEVPTRHGAPRWNPSTVRGILLNPRYAGRAIYQGRVTGKPGAWPPLVDEDVFEAVAARLADPRRKTNRHGHDRKHLGAGLYECAMCGRKLYGWTANRYHCPSGCLTRSAEPINALVLQLVRGRLARPDLADLLPAAHTGEAKRLTQEAKRLRARLAQIDEDYDAGYIDGQRYAVAMEKVRAELEPVEAARIRLTTAGSASAVLLASNPVAAFDDAPLMIKRSVIDALCVVRIGTAPRGRKGLDPMTLGKSQWVGDSVTWAKHWELESRRQQPYR